MKCIPAFLILMLGIVPATPSSAAFRTFPSLSSAQALGDYREVDLIITDFLAKTRVAGISISVSQKGELLYSKGFGYADVARQIKMEPGSRIRTASVAKVITATALGKLASEGKLDIDAPLKTYLPGLQQPYLDLSTRQIAGHTAGIPHRPYSRRLTRAHYDEVKETLSFFGNAALLFEADTDYQYSTLGYNLLANLIETVSGKRYIDYMREDIFVPLNMTQTAPDDPSAPRPEDASLYFIKDGALKRDKKALDGSYKLAGAGFRSTSVDLVNMMQAYQNGFIAEAVVADMFSSHTLADGQATHVGIGWRLNQDMNGTPTIEHAGSWQGARTVIVYYPEQELAISIMINTQCALFIEESAHIIAQFFLQQAGQHKIPAALSQSISLTRNQSDGRQETYTGELSLPTDKAGKLRIETDSEWLQQNEIHALPLPQKYALSTSYGLLYLHLRHSPEVAGELFQYQVLGDRYHMRQEPMLFFQKGN